jgi:hypothetical protein
MGPRRLPHAHQPGRSGRSSFPKGGDERDSKTNDSALAVYMLVPYSRISGPRAVKYSGAGRSRSAPGSTRTSASPRCEF